MANLIVNCYIHQNKTYQTFDQNTIQSPIITFKFETFSPEYSYKYCVINNNRRIKNKNIRYLYDVWIQHIQSKLIGLWTENRMKYVSIIKKMKPGNERV